MTKTEPRRFGIRLGLAWLGIFFATASFVLVTIEHRIQYDGLFYFATLRSIYFDRNIDFSNEAEQDPWMTRSFGKTLPNGLIANPFPVGSAVLWLPFYTAADAYCEIRSAFACDGYSDPYVIAIMAGTVFWTTLGLALNMLSLWALFPALPTRTAITTVIVMTLASPLIFYLTVDVDYAHGNSYFAVSLLLYLTVAYLRKEVLSKWQALSYGLAVGLVFSVRWQDIAMSLLAVPILLKLWGQNRPGALMILAAGALLGALPQLIFWNQLYGTPLTIPQGNSFLSIANIEALKFLFSTWNGVFLWHPLLLLAMAGLLGFTYNTLTKGQSEWRAFGLIVLVIVLLEMILSMMTRDWWAGGAFGQRRLVSILPLLSIGLHYLRRWASESKTWVKISLGILFTALVAWNLLTLLRFHQGKIPFNPADASNYASQQVYGHYDYALRFEDILTGHKP